MVASKHFRMFFGDGPFTNEDGGQQQSQSNGERIITNIKKTTQRLWVTV
jgi:hypothetical protein